MLRLGFSLVLFLAISGCNYSRPHAPPEVQELESRAADFRHRTLRRNVESVVNDLTDKLNIKWQEHNASIFEFSVYKLREKRNELLKDASTEDTKKIYALYESDSDKLLAQFTKANELNAEKLKKYRFDIIGKLADQFDRSEQADIILMRYMMGLQPGPFDSFLIGEPDVIQQQVLDAAIPKKE